MAYEYKEAVEAVGGSINKIADLLTDQTPDEQQIAQLVLEASNAILTSLGPLNAEEQTKFKAKFFAKVGFFVAASNVDKLELAEKDKESLRIFLNAASRVLDVQIADEPNA